MTKKDSTKKELLTQLKALIKELDDEGLLFLIEQANVLRYNMTVDKVNKSTINKQKSNNKIKSSKSNNSKSNRKNSIKIIMDDDKKNFILQIDSQRKFLTRAEFVDMVKVSQSSTLQTGSIKLYQWLNKERKDVLIDCSIHSNVDPKLKEIVKLIKENYKVKK